jgi:hypothetical protein
MEEPFTEATPPLSLHQTSNDGWPKDEVWLLPLTPSQNGYLSVRLPHVAGSQSACARWRRRSKQEAKSGRIGKAGCIVLACLLSG